MMIFVFIWMSLISTFKTYFILKMESDGQTLLLESPSNTF